VGLEPVGSAVEEVASGTSKSAVSRRFVGLTRTGLHETMSATLGHLDPVALLLDGVGFGDHLCVVALVIDSQGEKHSVGLIEGTTENARVATDLLADLRDRGLKISGGLLVVMDGARALRRAVQNVLGKRALVQRCQEH
jgi:putative transposase